MADKSGGQELNAGNLNGQRKAPQLDPSSLYKDSRMAKISKNLGDIVAERRQRLLQNANGGEVVQGEKVGFLKKVLEKKIYEVDIEKMYIKIF